MAFYKLQEPLAPTVLDALLARGWYRMHQQVFTTAAIQLEDGTVTEVLWARVVLDGYPANHRYRKLLRLGRHFTLSLQPAHITPEIEDLYTQYRSQISFDTSFSVADYLLGQSSVDYFPGRMWLMRDGGKLIAAGYFDEGTVSAAGILNFYHPGYRKFSPSLRLYLEGVRYAADQGRQYFYPGYIALGCSKFDYKLLAGPEHMEVWDAGSALWIPYTDSEHARLTRATSSEGRA